MYFIPLFLTCSKMCLFGSHGALCGERSTLVRARNFMTPCKSMGGKWAVLLPGHLNTTFSGTCGTFLAAGERCLTMWVTSLHLLLPGLAQDPHT